MPATKASFDNLKSLLEEYNTKQASVKSAYNVPEKGNASSVTTGSLYAENSADVKKDAPGASVEEAGTPGNDTSSNVHPLGLGLHQAEIDDMTGFDKIVKEYKYNVNKEAKFDLSTEDALNKAAAEFIQNTATVTELIKQARKNSHAKEAKQANTISGTATETTVDKNDQLAQAVIADHIKMAHDRATLVQCFYKGWNDTNNVLVKMAEDGSLKEVLDSQDTDDADEGSDEKSEVSEKDESEESGDEGASEGSEEDGGGEVPSAAPEATPVPAGLEGGAGGGQVDPAMLAALAGGASGSPHPGAGGGEADQLGAMSNGMLDIGQNPEMLQQLLMQALAQAQQEQQGQPPASMLGKMAKVAADKIKDHLAVVDVVKTHMYSGDFERGESKTAAQKKMRKEARKYYSELLREYSH